MNVTLSKATKEVADFFAHHQCLMDGLEVGTKNYDNAFKRNHHRFCEEALNHSLTPSGAIKNNPLPKSVKNEVSLKNVLDQFYSGNSTQQKVIENQVSSSVNSLVNAFLMVRLNKTRKGNAERGSDFAFNKKADKGTMTIEEKLEVENNRYLSYMVSGLMIGWIERFFKQDISIYDSLMRQAVDSEGKTEKQLLKLLSNPKYREQFIKKFYDLGKDSGK